MIILTPFPALDSKQRLFTKEIGNDLQVLKNSRKVASLTRYCGIILNTDCLMPF